MHPTPAQPRRTPSARRRTRLRVALAACALAVTGGLAGALPAPSLAPAGALALQDGKPRRPDQVSVRSRRGDTVSQVPGEVKENSLDKVVIATADGEQDFSSELVLRVTFGEVPSSYRDGMLYRDRQDFALAAGSFKQAAADGEARELVRAAARLRAAEALLALGAVEPTHFSDAAEEARRFLTDFPDNREVPGASLLLARALRLAGQATEAAAAYREVFDRLAGDQAAQGFERTACFRAGVQAADALLAAQDTLGARELYSSIASTLGPIVAGLEDSPERRDLQDVLDEASLGEGFAELAAGNSAPALTFFQNRERALEASSGDALRYGVLLGLGESLLAEGRPRDAQLALSQVSALDHTSRDRVARALLRLAEAGVKLRDPRETIAPLLSTLDASFGDTPSAAAARRMLQSL